MALMSSSHLGFLVFLACLLNPTGCLGHQGHADNHVALFIFGDSLYDPGNNNYINTTTEFQANFRPYGESFFKHPTGRFSDGRLIQDFIAEYANLPLIPAYFKPGDDEFSYGANFASGGAGALVETHSGYVINLKTQLSHFNDLEKKLRQKLGDNEAGQLLSNAVYLLSCGGNDYLSPAQTNNSIYYSYTEEQYVEMVIGNLTSVVKEIYEKRGRKFGFVTLPPLGCWPSIRAQQPGNKCREEVTALVDLHNKILSENLKKLKMQLKGYMYSKFDYYTLINERMKNPPKYGFKEGQTACCGSGPYNGIYSCGGKRGIKEYQLCDNASEIFFFDSNHFNEVACQQFAELFWHGNPNVTGPYNLKSLFEGKSSLSFSLNEEL